MNIATLKLTVWTSILARFLEPFAYLAVSIQ